MNRLIPTRSATCLRRSLLKRFEDGKNNIQQIRWYENYIRNPLDSRGTPWKTKTLDQSYQINICIRAFSSSPSSPSSNSSSSDSNDDTKESEGENSSSDEIEKFTTESIKEVKEEEEGEEENQEDLGIKTSTTKVCSFPWRHVSPIQPLPRVLEEDDLSGLPLNSRSRFVRKVLAARELDTPWLQILITKSWEKELAEKFSWAFQRAVAGVLSRTFQVPFDMIEDEESGFIKIDTTLLSSSPKPNLDNIMNNESEKQYSGENQNNPPETEEDLTAESSKISNSKERNTDEQNSEKNQDIIPEIEKDLSDNVDDVSNSEEQNSDDKAKEQIKEHETKTEYNDDVDVNISAVDEMKKEMEEFVSAMLEESLYNLYQPLSENTREWDMKFQMKPLRCRLESAFVVPMFTRDDVKSKPQLKGSYQAIEKEFARSGNIKLIREMSDKLAKETKFSGKRAIIADVSVDCLESIQFIEKKAGLENKNSEEKEYGNNNELTEVTHLVRFEMNTSKDKSNSKRQIGSWKIIDWDDMLDGNIWH